MHRQLFSLFVFFLSVLSAPVWAHGNHSHDSSSRDIAIQVQEQFLKYLKDPDGARDLKAEAYIVVNGQRYALNSSFYELLRLTLKATAPDVCATCVVEEVRAQSHQAGFIQKWENNRRQFFIKNAKFLQKWRDKARGFFSINTVDYGDKIIDEYGYAAGVGYVTMEVLEHTVLGPAGICPILNLYYISMLDNIKQSQFVFQATYKQSVFKAMYFAFRSAFETIRLNRALKTTWFNSQEHGAEVSTWENFKILRKGQGRYGWFLWSSWLDERLSRRTLWPSAYMNFDLEVQSHDDHDHEHASPFKMILGVQPEEGTKSFLSCEGTFSACNHDDPISEERLSDIGFIADGSQSQIQRYISASLLQDVLLFQSQALEVQLKEELEKRRAEIGTKEYLRKSKRLNRLNIKIKKYGAILKTLAMDSASASEDEKALAIKNLRDILSIFQKASLLREQEQSFFPLIEDIEKLLTCEDQLT